MRHLPHGGDHGDGRQAGGLADGVAGTGNPGPGGEVYRACHSDETEPIMKRLTMRTTDTTDKHIGKIAALFPHVVTETRDERGEVVRTVDFDLLRQELSRALVEGERERYQLTWPGKREAILAANAPTSKTLRPVREESVDWDRTRNLYIEGDNLEALKLLQEAYLNKVKCIYIDPPYNTGRDYIYRDNFRATVRQYLEETGQVDEFGNRLVLNTEANGRFHSDWLSMMYARLKVARNLLRDDGVIFISIDDHEAANLRVICDEIFGRDNFVATIIWEKVYSPRMDVIGFSTSHDYILCYVKGDPAAVKREPFEQNERQFNFVDEATGRRYRRRSIRKEGSNSLRSDAPNSFFPLEAPDGTLVYPIKPDGTEGCWRWSRETYEENLKRGLVEWVKTEAGWQVYAKQFLDGEATKPPETIWRHREAGHTHGAAEELKKLLGGRFFDSPKPKELIVKMLTLATDRDGEHIVLDFFSGSATTAHAVMDLNAKDGGNRRFILVQLPEPTDERSEARKAGYRTICDIGRERIRRAADKIRRETGADIDCGFRVFRVDSSNMKDVWYAPDEFRQADLTDFASNIKEDRTGEDLLVQVMLELGLDLSLPMETKRAGGRIVHAVGGNELVACFDEDVPETAIREMAAMRPRLAVFRDAGFRDDAARINVGELFKTLSPGTEIRVL
jgi:adenine-specific DNA-methyltransferase